jgi:hypothetical protein
MGIGANINFQGSKERQHAVSGPIPPARVQEMYRVAMRNAQEAPDVGGTLPGYERLTGGDYERLEEKLPETALRRTGEQQAIAEKNFMETMRRIGMGDDPSAFKLQEETIGRTFGNQRADILSNAAAQRYGLQSQEMGEYNVGMERRRQSERDFWLDKMRTFYLGTGQTSESIGKSQAYGGGGGGEVGCTFIFTATYGEVPLAVRAYRDKATTVRNRRGYYWFSDKVLPLMKKHKWIKRLMKLIMTGPMTSYGKWFYGLNKIGFIFLPVTAFWMRLFHVLGYRKPYQRVGTKEVV